MENFTVITDHRPLLSILNKQTLKQVTSPCIQRLKERLMRYNFATEWRQGRNHHLLDTLSRHPNEKPSEEDEKICKEMSLEINLVVMNNEISSDKNSNMREILEKDAEYILLRDTSHIDHFTNLGVPQGMRTNGGPQFTSYTFKKFMEKINIEHVVSRPHYPQSNGHAESAWSNP